MAFGRTGDEAAAVEVKDGAATSTQFPLVSIVDDHFFRRDPAELDRDRLDPIDPWETTGEGFEVFPHPGKR